MMYNGLKSETTRLERDSGRGMPARRGVFITIEGIDGSGKSTQASRLRTILEDKGYQVLQLREPGGTGIGEAIRKILLSKESDGMTAETELLLFEAARAQLVRQVIEPALEQGAIVLSDRFMDSTVAYQGYGRGMELSLVDRLNDFAVGPTRPDLTILLDLDPESAGSRLSGRSGKPDRLDSEGIAFMRLTRDGYLAIAAGDPDRFRILPADEPEDTTLSRIITMLKEEFGI